MNETKTCDSEENLPKFGDHGLSGRPVLRVDASLVVGPARGQNPQLRLPVWPRAE